MAQAIRKTRENVQEVSQEVVTEGASQAGVSIILTLAAIIGAWSLACIVSGITNAGGISQLARAWFGAVTGM